MNVTITLEVLDEGADTEDPSGLTEEAFNDLMNALGHWDFFAGVVDGPTAD